jgi:hypothetical protein
MLSFTIDGKEYLCPSGYGEIKIQDYATFIATVVPLAPNATKIQLSYNSKPNGFVARLTARINRVITDLKGPLDEIGQWESTIAYDAAFITHWLKCPPSLVDRIDHGDLHGLCVFINSQWEAWEPRPLIQKFEHDGRLWECDYSLEALLEIKHPQDPQSVLSTLCSSNGKRMGARKWGTVSLDIAASIMVEIRRQHTAIGTIVGSDILDQYDFTNNSAR